MLGDKRRGECPALQSAPGAGGALFFFPLWEKTITALQCLMSMKKTQRAAEVWGTDGGSVAQSNQVSCKGLVGSLQQNQGPKKDVRYQ